MKAFFSCFKALVAQKQPPAAGLLVFGIGNPGFRFAKTRHNIGFMVIDRAAAMLKRTKKRHTADAALLFGMYEEKKVAFAKPMTFVNRCGASFAALQSALSLPLGSCLVIVDDYNLPLGAVRMRKGGSDGGHNGLASIIASVGEQFPRLRVGIGTFARRRRCGGVRAGKIYKRRTPDPRRRH